MLCDSQVDDETFERLEEATEDEDDMLDEAAGLTATSRLGCQIILTKDLEGMHITLPSHR